MRAGKEAVQVEEGRAATFGLFGREDDLRILEDVLDTGGSAVATGDPGVGKSSLLRVADQLAQRRGRRVLTVTPRQFEQGLPFAGLAELVAQCPPGAMRSLPDPQRRGLAVALQSVEPDGHEVDALAVPLAVQGVLTYLCESEPVALIVDDVQWLDQASLGSFDFALRRIAVEPSRLSVLVGTRPSDVGANLIRSLPAPRRDFTLQPLEPAAIGQLLRTRLGARWTPPVSAGVARASSGNPYLALMIAEAMQSTVSQWSWSVQQGHDPVFPVPPSLVGLLSEKVTLLPKEARDTLLLVSAAGRLNVAQLEEIAGESKVRSALEAAADWDIATVGAGSAVTFTHPLLASAIYDVAPAAERRRAHRVLADALDDPVERARHRSRSVTAPDVDTAVGLERAADISRGRGALVLAGELFEGAALATPAALDTSESLGRWLRAVDTYMAAGDYLAAQGALDKGSSLALTPEQQAQVLVRRLRLADHYSGVRPLAEEAVGLAPAGSEIRAEILDCLGMIHRMQGDGPEALRLSRLAAEEAAEVDRLDVQLSALNNLLAVEWHWNEGDTEQTLKNIADVVERAGLEATARDVVWTNGFFAAWNDDTAEEHVRDGIAAAVATGRYGDLSYLYIALVLVLIRSSRVLDAATALKDSDRLGAWAASSLQEHMARVLVHEYAGDLDLARDLAQAAVAHSRSSGAIYWEAGFLAQVGFIETSARNWPTAFAVLSEVAEIFVTTGIVDLEQLLWAVDYADAALQVGALEAVEAAIAVLRRQGSAGRPEALVAAGRCEALLMAANGSVDDAVQRLVKITGQDGAECPFEAARSMLALGQVYRRSGRKALAHEALAAAAASFEALGIPRWAERARDEAGRTGLHATPNTLTESERRVAELVAQGHSNHEVAAEMFISVKTVEANLTRVYRKLSVRSRTELAVRLGQGAVKSEV